MMWRHFILLTLLMFLSTPAGAQTDDVAALNKLGMQEFAAGRYAEAADIFTRAYALEPRPELMKNAAVAWYRAERCPDAIGAATNFLQSAQISDAEAAQMRGLMGACKVQQAQDAVAAGTLDLAERLLAEVQANAPDEALQGRVDAVRIELAERRTTDNEPDVEGPPPTVEPKDPVVQKPTLVIPPEPASTRTGGTVLTAVGGAVLVSAIVYHVIAQTQLQTEFRDVAANGTDRNRYDQLDRSLRLANVLVPITYIVGGIAIGTGIYLWASRTPRGDTVVGWRTSF